MHRTYVYLAEQKGVEIELVTIGKRVYDYYKRRPYKIAGHYADWSGVPNFDRTREIVKLLTERFTSGQTDEIIVIFTRFLSLVRYKVECEKYLPVARPSVGADTNHGLQLEYIFEPSAEDIYAALMPSYAVTKMVTAVVESFASEHGSRMMAMGNATTNAGEMIDTLTLDYNKARQAQITKELLEVVAGADALKG